MSIHSGPNGDPWASLLPNREDVTRIVGHVARTWKLLCANSYFHIKRDESDLTKMVAVSCDDTKSDAGLIGVFDCELMQVEFDRKTGRVYNERRSDVEYRCQRSGVELIFEFKKLKTNAHRSAYIGGKGILKFVDGRYARSGHFGVMVAIVERGDPKPIAALKRSLARPENIRLVRIMDQGQQEYLITPSATLPDLALFDTQHTRCDLAETETIQLAHVRLDISPE